MVVDSPILGTFLHSSCNAEREEDRLWGMFAESCGGNGMATFPGMMFHDAHEPFLFGQFDFVELSSKSFLALLYICCIWNVAVIATL